MTCYYNENDPKAAAWLKALIAAELIPAGTVDERTICDVQPKDLEGFQQVHFFAGIGGWAYALELASWPTDVPVWTGSCPCQPFSQAGKGKGENDSRHLWPEMRRLIGECGPAICFGEQVASKAGRGWLNRVRLDLEGMGYGVGAADLCAACVGAPHIRQRLYWLAYAGHFLKGGGQGGTRELEASERCESSQHVATDSTHGWLGNSIIEPRERDAGSLPGTQAKVDGERIAVDGSCSQRLEHASSGVGRMGNSRSEGPQERIGNGRTERRKARPNPWEASVLASCRDGKARRIEPGLEPLAHGIPGRVAQLRGLGNAIVPQVAAEFIGASLECMKGGVA